MSMRYGLYRLLLLSSVLFVIALIFSRPPMLHASPMPDQGVIDSITKIHLNVVDVGAALPSRPPCLRCGGNKIIDAHAGDYIRANQPLAAWRLTADMPAPPLRPHSIC